MIGRLFVACSWWLVRELPNVVRPITFTAHAKLDERFDAVPDRRAASSLMVPSIARSL